MNTRQRGFTLFELAVVIVIVVLLIYAALPRLSAALRDARETAVRMNARALQEGVMRAKAVELIDGLGGAVYNLPNFGDGTLDMSAAGFPSGSSRSPGDRLSGRHCAEIWSAVLEPNPGDPRGATESDFVPTVRITSRGPVCIYAYRYGGMSIGYDPATGAVWADAQFKGFGLFE